MGEMTIAELLDKLREKLAGQEELGEAERESLNNVLGTVTMLLSAEVPSVASMFIFRRQIDDLFLRLNSLIDVLEGNKLIDPGDLKYATDLNRASMVKSVLDMLEGMGGGGNYISSLLVPPISQRDSSDGDDGGDVSDLLRGLNL